MNASKTDRLSTTLAALADPTRRAILAKLARAGRWQGDEVVVAYVTGHGLKTVEALTDTVGPLATIPPTLDAFDAVVDLDAEHTPAARSSS